MQLEVEFSPLGDHVLVEPLDKTQVTASGIVLTAAANDEMPEQATVVAVGRGGTYKDCPDPSQFLTDGQTVVINKWAGEEMKIKDLQGKEHTLKLLHLAQIYGISKKTK